MGCIYKISEGMADFTDTESRLANYILDHKDEATLSSAQQLGERAGVSASAVTRFAHRLGYSGFTALKLDLARDHAEEVSNFDDMIKETDSTLDVIRKAEALSTRLQNQAYRLLDVESLQHAVDVLLHCRTIYLFGISGSGIVCMDLMEKLSRIDRRVIYHQDFHDQLAATAHISSRDAALAISYGGKTHEVNTAMQYAKERGASTIAVTQFRKSPLTRYADTLLYIPTTERELRLGAIASRNASLIVTDMLYMCMVKNDVARTNESLVKTRELIERL